MIFSISLLHLLSIPAPAHMFVLLFRPISLILVVQATAMAEYTRKDEASICYNPFISNAMLKYI